VVESKETLWSEGNSTMDTQGETRERSGVKKDEAKEGVEEKIQNRPSLVFDGGRSLVGGLQR
jgi:hypothetical protein